jgi:Glycosyl hydrolase family 10
MVLRKEFHPKGDIVPLEEIIRRRDKDVIMSTVKTILAIVVILVLASCGTNTPAATPTTIPTNAPPPTATATATATPASQDILIYRNSFEEITDLAASGITSNVDVTLNTDNFNYPGGGTALEIKGTLPGAQYSSIYVDFAIKKLTGETSLDLTNKTIYYSAYIPADSAIDNISVYAGKGTQFVQLAGITADNYWKKGAWHDYQFDLTTVQGLMKDNDTIRIVGQRNLSGGDPTTANFFVDDLKWIGIDIFNIPVDNNVDSLRKYAASQHFKFGLWTGNRFLFGLDDDPSYQSDPWYAYLAAQEGIIYTVWSFEAKANQDYSIIDYDTEYAGLIKQYNYGNGNSMTTLGYGIGCAYHNLPDWWRNLAFPDATEALMLYQIEKDLRYTQGQNPIWLLFNEFISGEGTGGYFLKNRQGQDLYSDYSPWAANPTDSSLIKAAFIKAREVDPGATLLLNDFDDDQIGLIKSEFFYKFATGLKNEGIPLDGVGWQMHNRIDPKGNILLCRYPISSPTCSDVTFEMDTYLTNVDLNVKRYASVGLKVAFTEVEGYIKIDDLDLTSAAGRAEYESRLQWQARYYAGLLKIAMDNDNVILYHMWGVTDRYPAAPGWPGYGNPYIFDKNYNPKPAYEAMLELLKAP